MHIIYYRQMACIYGNLTLTRGNVRAILSDFLLVCYSSSCFNLIGLRYASEIVKFISGHDFEDISRENWDIR
jgi:hypothetical protein